MERNKSRAGLCAAGIPAALRAFLRAHGGRILYYGGVALALGAIAYAAEQYRVDRPEAQEALILPAAEIEVPVPEAKVNVLHAPEGGVLLNGYSDMPRWNRVLSQWQNHPGVDYICAGDEVASLCAGVIHTVGESGIYGGFVEIEAGEYLLRYASVEAAEELHPGMKIEAGDILGIADASMPGEAHLGAHLHLELYKNGQSVDFEAELNKNF